MMARITKYECKECGTRLIITESLESNLSPIFCCGIEVASISAAAKKLSPPAKKTASKKTVKQAVKKPSKGKSVTTKKPVQKGKPAKAAGKR
jgi:hypothetical protein